MAKTIHRSAITGEIVTEKFAKDNPDTTVKETILNHNLDPIELRVEIMAFCDFLEENGRPIDYDLIDEYLNGKK